MKPVKAITTMSMAITLSAITLSGVQACEQGSMSNFDHMITILKDANGNSADTDFYNFSTGNCEKISSLKNEVEISSYIPKDETSLGLYNMFRAEGQSPQDAVMAVYHFDLDNS